MFQTNKFKYLNKILTLGLILFLNLFSYNSFAQKSFSADSVKYIKELKSFMANSPSKSTKPLLKKFQNFWEEGIIDEKFRADIYHHSNEMIKRRLRAYPHFELYLNTMMVLAEKNLYNENYKIWSNHYSNILKNKRIPTNKIKEFLQSSLDLFFDNYLYKNTIVGWKAENQDYVLETKDKDLIIRIPSTTLTCYAKQDSTQIFETEGIYNFSNYIFEGKGGLVTWERSGVSRDSISAKLNDYSLNLKKSEYSIDTVLFFNKLYLNKPMYGRLEDKVVQQVLSKDISYPRFSSFTQRIELKNIFEKVNYSGGFSMKGAQFYGSGNKETPATLSFFRKDTLVLSVKTLTMIFKQDKALSSGASATFYLEEDSIYHPGLKFNYNIKKREVTLTRDKDNLGRVPYINTYHGLDMSVGKVVWNMNKPKLELLPGPLEKISYFESVDYYSEKRYMDLQRMDDTNPLVAVAKFVKKNANYKVFHAEDFSNYMRMSIPATHRYLLNLAFQGFITYDLETEEVTVLDKTYHYIRASVGKKDYDILGFVSKAENKNGEISLLNYDFKMHGVNQVFLSDSQNVVIFPKNGVIYLQKNRDFKFDGRVNAGLFDFFGSNFFFSYKNFKIDLNNVEEAQMYLRSKTELNKYGEPVLIPIQTRLHNIKGDLLIDKPFNKSGIKPSPEYPIFNSEQESYAYYDSPNIQDGAYHKDNFYFQIQPYSLDSLDDLTRKNLVFDGVFRSADIFPDFNERIGVRPDYSLGFHKETGSAGMPMYKGKGNYSGIIDLSNRGLLGAGDLTYIHSTTSSEQIIMLPEIYKALDAKFDNPMVSTPPEYPLVDGKNVSVQWYANLDSLVTKSIEKPIKIYEDSIFINGYTYLQPSGMTARGLIDLKKAEITSKLFRLKSMTFTADTSDFILKGEENIDFDFKAVNVNALIDFNQRKGILKSNGEGSSTTFRRTQYVCFMDEYIWYMDEDKLDMKAGEKAQSQVKSNEDLGYIPEDNEQKGAQFISIKAKQDSLNFVAQTATYNIKTKAIKANEVPYIRVADAIIYPDNGTIEIEKEAKMQTLSNAKIVANCENRLHTIFNAEAHINSRKKYTASGDYEYINQDKAKQIIHFDEIGIDSLQTYAKGTIPITNNFTLSQQFAYNGKVHLTAEHENLFFNGFTKIAHNCNRTQPQWMKFKSEIAPEEIMIPFNKLTKTIDEQKLHASLMITNDSSHIYPAFVNVHKKHTDTEIVPAEGFLIYDKAEGKYIISSKEKLEDRSLPGNLISIQKEVCNVYGEGIINLGVDFGRFKMQNAGNINQSGDGKTTVLNLVTFLEFFFNDKCLEIMAKDMELAIDGTDPLDVYYQGVTEIVGTEDSKAYFDQLNAGKIKKYPKKFEKGILLSELKLRWNQDQKCYDSEGPIGIGNILKKQVNRLVPGNLRITKKRSGSEFHLYLEPTVGVWYYFQMSRNVLRVASSNDEFNTILRDMKASARKLKAEKYEKPYSFFPATEGVMKRFLKQLEKDSEETEEDTETNDEDLYDDDF